MPYDPVIGDAARGLLRAGADHGLSVTQPRSDAPDDKKKAKHGKHSAPPALVGLKSAAFLQKVTGK